MSLPGRHHIILIGVTEKSYRKDRLFVPGLRAEPVL